MFCKWDCGCIGIASDDHRAIVIIPCEGERDSPRNSLSWFKRNMIGKTSEPLDVEDEVELHQKIAQRFGAADRFDLIAQALR
jgi:hypothetical protein